MQLLTGKVCLGMILDVLLASAPPHRKDTCVLSMSLSSSFIAINSRKLMAPPSCIYFYASSSVLFNKIRFEVYIHDGFFVY